MAEVFPMLVQAESKFTEKLYSTDKFTVNCYSVDSFHDKETEVKEKSEEANDIIKLENEINK